MWHNAVDLYGLVIHSHLFFFLSVSGVRENLAASTCRPVCSVANISSSGLILGLSCFSPLRLCVSFVRPNSSPDTLFHVLLLPTGSCGAVVTHGQHGLFCTSLLFYRSQHPCLGQLWDQLTPCTKAHIWFPIKGNAT